MFIKFSKIILLVRNFPLPPSPSLVSSCVELRAEVVYCLLAELAYEERCNPSLKDRITSGGAAE